jgi:hypothetical protein
MPNLPKLLAAAALALPLACSAAWVQLTGVSFEGGAVKFDTVRQPPLAFELVETGASRLVELAHVHLLVAELLDPDMRQRGSSATLAFARPGGDTLRVTAHAALVTVPGTDGQSAAGLRWQPVVFDDERGGRYEVQLQDVVLTLAGEQSQTALVTLLATPLLSEPGSLALIALACAGAYAATGRRRQSARLRRARRAKSAAGRGLLN